MATPAVTQPRTQASPLVAALARVLPKDHHFTAWHLSTTPAVTGALCYPASLKRASPNIESRPTKPLKTYCEKHFLAISIPDPATNKQVVILGLEIYIYSTSFWTNIFVSKADSTGYLHIQPTGSGSSPIRDITLAFVQFLVEHRKRPSKYVIVNLFARAQSQYLFPGSADNKKKHILDDRGLIKWWCRVLNPLLEHEGQNSQTPESGFCGYLIIPGLDDHETRAFLPRTKFASRNWTLGHPLERISPYTTDPATFGDVPPRCLIPTYPDDPKARFVEELEESTPEKSKLSGGWKTPKTLDQFWDMMSFRQECSSGRLTGFVWLVFDPVLPSVSNSFDGAVPHNASENTPSVGSSNETGQGARFSRPPNSISPSARLSRRKSRSKKVLKGPIVTRAPKIKTRRAKYPDRIETPYYYWPKAGRGQVVLDDHGYTRAVELLLHLEFKGLEQAIASTSRWVDEVNMGEDWALPIVGEKQVSARAEPTSSLLGTVNNLQASVVKKRKIDDSGESVTEASSSRVAAPVNLLGRELVQKRTKADTGTEQPSGESKVQVLGSAVVRKKPKA
ncbi:hypothetical protein GGS20DRAFT_569048 [Poronia punctata]|nr:hypothetical protein GGS20DRAFT_569048 [Poronia punctata]